MHCKKVSLWERFTDYLFHKTFFHGKPGAVDLFGLTEEDVPDTDGVIIVLDGRSEPKTQRAYAYRFENRYYATLPIGNRVMAVFQAVYAIHQIRPLAVVENKQAYTPFGHYDRLSKQYQQSLLSSSAI